MSVKSYYLAPNFTTAPPPKGPIKLGSVLKNLKEFAPLNRHKIEPIRDDLLNPEDKKSGFSASRSRLLSGELGIFAKVIGSFAIGVDGSVNYKKSNNDVLSFTSLDTVTFDPDDEYITECLKLESVQNFLQMTKFRTPVYLITGLKIGRGGSMTTETKGGAGGNVKIGMDIGETSANLGPKFTIQSDYNDTEKFEDSTDFIVAFRVRKIIFKKGKSSHEVYDRGAVMADGIVTGGEVLEHESTDDISAEGFKTAVTQESDETETWFLRQPVFN